MPDLTQFKDHSGQIRSLVGVTRTPPGLVGAFRRYGNNNTLLSDAECSPFEIKSFPMLIEDQGQTSACNAHATKSGIEASRFAQGMSPYVRLDPWSFYALLCNGRDVGSSITEALKLAESFGVAPWGTLPRLSFDPWRIPPSASPAAAANKLQLGEEITTRQELLTAVVRQEPVNLSICVGDHFDELSSTGLVTLGNGPCNHSIIVRFGLRINAAGRFELLWQQSWGVWGINGQAWLPLDGLVDYPNFSAFRMKSVVASEFIPDAV
jgi:hypothetical protein